MNLEPLTLDIAIEAARWRNEQPRQLRTHGHTEEEGQREWFNNQRNDNTQMWWAIVEDGEAIGYCGVQFINWLNRNGEISFLMAPEHQDKWAMAFQLFLWTLFEVTPLHTVWAEVYTCSENVADWNQAHFDHHCERGFMPCRKHLDGEYYGADMYTFWRPE